MASNMTFRYATEDDCRLILFFIRELAAFENLAGEVVASEELLREWLFEKKTAEVLFVCEGNKEVGFALYFYSYSTFLGRPGIFVEDLFVVSEYRRRGYGKALLNKIAAVAVERGCGRIEWPVLKRNQTGIAFYESLGAKPLNDWTIYRMEGETLTKFAAQ